MDERLKIAAQEGDIAVLYNLIREEPYLLDNIDAVPFIDTPLHIAAYHGKIPFAMEIIRLKPSFAQKLNQDGFSPMHLALHNRQTKMVIRFLDKESDLVRVQGREGKTPLHHVAEEEDLDLLIKFLSACPTSIQDVTIQRETALHIAVKKGKNNALDVLIGGLRRACYEGSHTQEKKILNMKNDEGKTVLHVATATNQPLVMRLLRDSGIDVDAKDDEGKTALHVAAAMDQHELVKLLLKFNIQVNAKDEEGNTALHIATATNQPQIVRLLLKSGIHVNAKNSRGLTALDISDPQKTEIREILQKAKAKHGDSQPQISNSKDYLLTSKISFYKSVLIYIRRSKKNINVDTRNVLLVVAALILTATYQSGLSPPGGVWQDNQPGNATNNDFNTTTNTENTTNVFNTSSSTNTNNSTDLNNDQGSSEAHKAGTLVMPHVDFQTFFTVNSITLLTTTLVIFFLLPISGQVKWLLDIPLYLFSLCYMIAWQTIAPNLSDYHFVYYVWERTRFQPSLVIALVV
ncbi:hypothetical protein FEM48_Zijuj11G0071100 [Ziziphus jujuba var. spinosa]|uniref:PGG domain-containing protein n=1 Tax=Ziziphus jujuba var. spinosa TaxID=714518 RepID=A0A978UHJ1_ZIZJJ|nr:hypothetical protein FEM48_Zijuj11G0071100 [Ziziphus jujuba var. spinosa]